METTQHDTSKWEHNLTVWKITKMFERYLQNESFSITVSYVPYWKIKERLTIRRQLVNYAELNELGPKNFIIQTNSR